MIAAVPLPLRLLAAGLLCGCTGSDSTPTVKLSVFAASSLAESFQDIEAAFERQHPHYDVRLTFAGSQVLRLQVEQGAPADVYASANMQHMSALSATKHISQIDTFATNELALIVPLSNPAGLERFKDLPKASRIVIGTDNVPVGRYTAQLFANAKTKHGDSFITNVLDHVVSKETNVRIVRAKVELGEADAAFVYRSDALASKQVKTLPIPKDINPRAQYQIGSITSSPHSLEAARFIHYVLSPDGQKILSHHGFTGAAQ